MLKFPDLDKPPPSATAQLKITYNGEVEEKKDLAIGELLREYDAKFLRRIEDRLGRLFLYEIPRKYLIHAVRKLRRANFAATEGHIDGAGQ